MAFFRNNAINLLNAHYALHMVALSGGGAFFLVYLVQAGVPVPAALVAMALVLVGRFLVRPFLVRLAIRFGLRRLLAAGTMLTAAQYPLLAEVNGLGVVLGLLVVLTAISDTIYWTCYHAYFAALGDDEHRGHQLGAREGIAALISVASPLVTGWLLAGSGPRLAFGLNAAVSLASAIPLLLAPDVAVARQAESVWPRARRSFLLFAADGWMAAGFVLVWQIALFTSLGSSFVAYGGAMAVAALVAALLGPLLGRVIDGGGGRRAVLLAAGVYGTVIIVRALAHGDAGVAVAANAAGAVVAALYAPTLMTAVYTEAKASPCPLRFHVATEGAWDIGGAAGLLTAALLLSLGLPIELCIVLALAGIVLNVLVLADYYAPRPLASP